MSICVRETPDMIVFNSCFTDISLVEFIRRLKVLNGSKPPPVMLTGFFRIRNEQNVATASHQLSDVAFLTDQLVKFLNSEGKRKVLVGQGICLDPTTKEVTRFGRRITLHPTQFRLLQLLMERRGKILRRQELAEVVSEGDHSIGIRSIDVYMGRLRKALVRGSEMAPIRTVRGVGYSFE